MAYVVTEECIKCKYMDCIATCPVNCFYEGENMLVIHPDECIDCATCEAKCPIEAIVSDNDWRAARWLPINRQYASLWPRIVEKALPPEDAKRWEGVPDKFVSVFSPEPGRSGARVKGT